MQQRHSPSRGRPVRRFLYSLIVFVVLAGGLVAGLYFSRDGGPAGARPTAPHASMTLRADPMDAAPPLRIPKLILPEEPGADGAPVRPYEESPPEPIYEPGQAPVRKAARTPPSEFDGPNARPHRRDGGPPTWRLNAVPFTPAADRPIIAVIIDDAGVDRGRTRKAVALPAPLTIAFLPYARDVARQAAEARTAGHELMVHVSMQPGSTEVDPGPRVLRTGSAPGVVLDSLVWALGQFDGYVGINNHMGSRFTADSKGMTVVMGELRRRGLLFVDSRTTRDSVGEVVAGNFGVPSAHRNVFLDHEPKMEVVRKQLAQLEAIAAKQGFAIAIGHPRDATIEALREWLPTLAAKGFALAPVSAVVALKQSSGFAADGR